MRHEGPIAGIAASGPWIATAGYDNRLILWDAASRRAVARVNHDHLVNACAFSADGRWLVSASSDYSARVWSVPSLALHTVLPGHGDDVDMAVFSPDDRRIATCALDRIVRIFDMDGCCLHEMRGHTGNVLSLAWSLDGRQVVSSSVDGTLRRWDAEAGTEFETLNLEMRTDSVAIGLDGAIYAGDDFGRIAIVANGRTRFVDAHRAGVKKLALDGARGVLVSLSYDGSMAVWHLGGLRGLIEVNRGMLPDSVWARAAAVLPDGRVVTGTFGSTYAVFDPTTSKWDMAGVRAGAAINAVLKVADRVYSVGDAGIVRVDGEHHEAMGSLCNFLVASGDRVLTGGQLGKVFDADTGAVLYEHHSPLNCGVAVDRQGRPHVAIGSYTGEILVFAVAVDGGLNLEATLVVYENAVKGLSCSEGLLFSVCASASVAWHRVDDLSPVRRVGKGHDRIANACCPIGPGRFASVSRDRTLRLWSEEGAETHPTPHLNSVKCIGVNDARTAVLTGSYGGTLALFDLVEKQWSPLIRPTTSGISSIAWDPARESFLAASYDGSIYAVPA